MSEDTSTRTATSSATHPVTTQTPSAAPEKKTNFLGIGLALLLAVAAFFSGVHVASQGESELSLEANLFSLFAAAPTQPDEVDLTEFWRVWNLMEDKFAPASSTQALTPEERIRGAIEGMVDSYEDPYTIYLPPADSAYFQEDISGNFSGVGMEVGMRDGVVTIIAPLPDTPAENAGLLAGDKILAVDGESTERQGIDEVVRRIRGEKGTEVVLTILRDGENDVREVPVVRDTIAIPTIETEQRGDVFIIRLFNFNALSEMRMQGAMREYVQSDADHLILDLRGNPGGFLQSAVSIASYFLPVGKVIVRESFGGESGQREEVFRSQGKTLRDLSPDEMVVLVDRGSASASEILAGALREHGVAVLIGQTTFGKGSVQELVDLPGGSSLKVTVARWLTPNGTSISDGGLEPDIAVERTPEQYLSGEDPQLEAALEYLNRGGEDGIVGE